MRFIYGTYKYNASRVNLVVVVAASICGVCTRVSLCVCVHSCENSLWRKMLIKETFCYGAGV